jgi:hypothetical protein
MNRLSFLILPLALALVFSVPAEAASDLMLFPTRVVFDGNRRAAQIDLTNTGNEVASYRVTLQNKRMTELGEFQLAESAKPGELFADGLVQYSPRQVELAPGMGQVVRIVLRKPADLAPGEYRTHLVFTRLPNAQPMALDKTENKPKEIGVSLKALIGVSIPIIVQVGETSAQSTLTDLKYVKATADQPPVLDLKILRTGTRSLYGDLKVLFKPNKGAEQELANIKGIAVYSPNPFRQAKIALRPEGDKPLAAGTITVTYKESAEAGGKLLSEASLALP